MQPSKTRRQALAWGFCAAAVLLLAAVGLALCAAGTETVTAEDMARTVAVCDGDALTNLELNYCFWNEYAYLLDQAGGALPTSLDPSLPLDEQTVDGQTTWEDYLLEQTLSTVRGTMALAFGAREAGFALPDDYQASLETVLERQDAQAAEEGYADTDAYLEDAYGPGADRESFRAYLERSYLAAAYAEELYQAPQFSREEIEAYRSLHAGDYEDADSALTDAGEDLRQETYENAFRALCSRCGVEVDLDAVRLARPVRAAESSAAAAIATAQEVW